MVAGVILHHLAQPDRLVVRQILLLHEYARIGVLPIQTALPHQFDSLRGLLLQFLHTVLKFGLRVYRFLLLDVRLLRKESLLVKCIIWFLISDDRVCDRA